VNKKILFLILLVVLTLTGYPLGHVLAQLTSFCGGSTGTVCITDYKVLVNNILNAVWIIFAAIVLVCFVLSGILFLTAQGDPEKLRTARSAFIWGSVGVVVGIVAYSIIVVVARVLGV